MTVGTGSNTITLGTGVADIVHTGSGSNLVVASADAVSADSIMGALTSGNGSQNRLQVTTFGTVDASGVSGFDTYALGNGGADSLTLNDANFARLPAGTITVLGGDSGNLINAAALSAAHSIDIYAGAGIAALTGGAAADTFHSGPGQEMVHGGGGVNTMTFAGPRSPLRATTRSAPAAGTTRSTRQERQRR